MQNLSNQTECNNKDAYKEWELEAYADGEEMAHVAAHLAACPVCEEEFKQLTAFSAQTSSKLYRFDCPSPDDLRAYYWQELVESTATKIQTHLALCMHCTGEVNSIRTLVETDPLAENAAATVERSTIKDSADAAMNKLRQQVTDIVERIDIAVATLVTPLAPQTAGVALRGEHKKPSMLLFETGETDISLSLQQGSDENWKIAGQVLIPNGMTEGKYMLIAEDKDALPNTITDRVEESGAFAAASVPSGVYQLIFHLKNNAIVIPSLTIGA